MDSKVTETENFNENLEYSDNENNEEEDEGEDDLNDIIEKDVNDKDLNEHNCLYQSTNILSDDDDDIIYDSEEDNKEEEFFINDDDRITVPIMTKYEYVRILGFRIKQITLGSKKFLKNVDNLEIPDIARLEIKHKMTPLKIKRPLPNNRYEIWKISELEIPKFEI